MSTFQVPYSSSPPSTPDSRRKSNPFANSFASNPSTTPAGPPPGSSLMSFTPAGNPPSSRFGSSPPNASRFSAKGKSPLSTEKNGTPLFGQPKTNNVGNGLLFGTRAPNGASFSLLNNANGSSKPSMQAADEDEVMREDDDRDDDPLPSRRLGAQRRTSSQAREQSAVDSFDNEDNTEGARMGDFSGKSPTASRKPMFNDSVMARFGATRGSDSDIDWAGSSLLSESPRGMKRSRGGAIITNSPMRRSLRRTAKESPLPDIIKGMANQLGIPRIKEPGEMILQTEAVLNQLDQEDLAELPEEEGMNLLSKTTEQVDRIWSSHQPSSNSMMDDEDLAMIGPPEDAPDHQRAAFLASLLLQIHHPPPAKGRQAYAVAKRGKFGRPDPNTPLRPTPMPKVLLDWLDRNHNPYPNAGKNMLAYHPSVTASGNYWDVIHSCTLRGKIAQVIEIFERSQFQYALTSRDDGFKHNGYQGQSLSMVDAVIDRCVIALKPYLDLQDGALDISRNDRILFRQGILKANHDLTTLAEGKDQDFDLDRSTRFEASNFGLKPTSTLLSQSLRRAESRVPWTIYQNLKTIYGILLGNTVEVIAASQDWVESTIALTAWWDGSNDDDDGISVSALAQSSQLPRRAGSLRATQSNRLVDINPSAAYQRRLAVAFERVTDEKDDFFQVDTLNTVSVGLASIFESNVSGVMGVLKGWSSTVAAATAEIATYGGWYPVPEGMEDLDASDLLVLSSYGQPVRQQTSKDDVLVEYSSLLFNIPLIEDKATGEQQEGWTLSIQILARLEDNMVASQKLKQLIAHLPLETDKRVDKVLEVCTDFGMEKEASGIAERYASTILSSSTLPHTTPPIPYGTALNYYARAHAAKHIHSLFNTLISLSLLHSAPYPPAAEMDPNLAALVDKTKAKNILKWLKQEDEEAAAMLGWFTTGYATLRYFYDLRDGSIEPIKPSSMVTDNNSEPSLSPDQLRSKAAFEALLAIIASAADPIQGGLYDPERQSVVQVDALLCLLGETLPFLMDAPTSSIPNSHDNGHATSRIPPPTQKHLLTLLRAIEALDTVDPATYQRCEDAFRACLTSYHQTRTQPDYDPISEKQDRAILSKQISTLTSSSSALSNGSHIGSGGSSGFLLTGSEMLEVMSASESGSFGRSSSVRHHGAATAAAKKHQPSNEVMTINLDSDDEDDNDNGPAQQNQRGDDPRDENKGWDWRNGLEGLVEDEHGFEGRSRELKGADVSRILRLGVERKLGEIWARGV